MTRSVAPMHELASIKFDDKPSQETEFADAHAPVVDLSHLLGTWINTCRETGSFSRFTLARSASGYLIEVLAATDGGPRGLGSTVVRPFAPNVNSGKADGFTAAYDFGFLEMSLAAYCAKGLIVVSQYTHFKDDSARPDYFNREFFFKEES
jgi:hypothetical protein